MTSNLLSGRRRDGAAFFRGLAASTMTEHDEENLMRELIFRMAGGNEGEGGDSPPGEPWPGPQDPPSPDGGPKAIG